VPIRIADIAGVGEGLELRGGAATQLGEEVVLGTAIMLIGADSRTVSKRVETRLAEIRRTLPPGISMNIVYTRGKLVDATLETLRSNLMFGALLVIAVLLVLLGNVPGALIVALVIPLALLAAVSGMVAGAVSANLLSLGAVDFGIIVDGAVVMIENVVRRLDGAQRAAGHPLSRAERLDATRDAAREMARPTLTGVAIIMIVYLPILTLTGVEGKMFRPMAEVVLMALAAALLLTFTFVPAAAATFVSGRVHDRESLPIRTVHRAYRPALAWALRRRRRVVVIAVLLVVACGVVFTRIG
jgi:cobalt-zinc-cadmium resistance protein CzcA